MPDWFTSLFAKLFGNEPLVKVMYSIIVWAIVLMICPDWLAGQIQSKSGIPYFYPVVIFSVSFVLVDLAYRAYVNVRLILRHYINSVRSEAQQNLKASMYDSMAQTVDNLNSKEKDLLAMMIEEGLSEISLVRTDALALSLCEKGILENHGPSMFDRRKDNLTISDKYHNIVYKKLIRHFDN